LSPRNKKVEVSVYQEAKIGNYQCGDSYFYTELEDEFVCAIADGLGSGEFAKESSQIVIDIVKRNIHVTVEQLMSECNKQLSSKRGAVLGVLKIDFKTNQLTYSSIGNIGMMMVKKDKSKKRSIPSKGYLAGYRQPFKVVQEKLEAGMNVFMFSDGVADRELSRPFFTYETVANITREYEHRNSKNRYDDTTLIAMHYKG